ncbi:hypothetical protein EDC96DRAFT_535443 [Choanephora cucurbitarum]|nr:hypothetical protein EDC96DRAFT_535443 [Choanephora cucurbitarum]
MPTLPPVVIASSRSAACFAAVPPVLVVSVVSVVSAASLAITNSEQKALKKFHGSEVKLAQIKTLMIDTDSAPDPSKGRNRYSMHILNKFFRSVDEQDLIDEGTSRDERTYTVVEEQLSATLRDALPVWALKS